MTQNTKHKRPDADARFDRLCDHLTVMNAADAPWGLDANRGALDLGKDGAQHRRFHSFYEDLLN